MCLVALLVFSFFTFFFFSDTATTEIYTLSLHDALPICGRAGDRGQRPGGLQRDRFRLAELVGRLRRQPTLSCQGHEIGRATRLNSSHLGISYAVFCLKKKKKNIKNYNKKNRRHMCSYNE